MDFDYDFWITVLLAAVAGGIFGPLIIKWLRKAGWFKNGEKQS